MQSPDASAANPRYRGQWRDEIAVWLCNGILHTVATRRYRLTLDTLIRRGWKT